MHFNSHAHVERDKCFSLNAWERTNFNSHAHVERDAPDVQSKFYDSNFNSHAHVERDGYLRILQILILISTHTLTWSVTNPSDDIIIGKIFQLTRSRGA